jgi:ribosomal-protein-alanine N-acetyltransferase
MIEKSLLLRDAAPATTVDDWRIELPVLAAGDVRLREVEPGDAAVLSSLLTAPEVTRFISAPPESVEGFERFILASRRVRAAGQGACFAVTLRDFDTALGIFQVRCLSAADGDAPPIAGGLDTAEWGFALGSPFWGSGIFEQGAALIGDFVFEQMGIRRLEARCAARNGRGGRALMKMGAVPEGLLRRALICGDEQLDQVLYAIVDEDWRRARQQAALAERTPFVH